MLPLALSTLLAVLAPGQKAPASSCPRLDPIHSGGTQLYGDGLGGGICFVSVSPMDTQDLVYRSYGFFSDGMLLVFNSFGPGNETSRYTGAREFYFFPRTSNPAFTAEPSVPAASVTMSDGGVIDIDTGKAQPRSADRGTVAVAAAVDRGNKGGVEFPSYAGLMLDAGFRMGELPSGRPEAESVFRDANGLTCAVKNKEVFVYANGDRAFAFDDAGLKTFLKSRCPLLSVYF